jgi:hypothetical protein
MWSQEPEDSSKTLFVVFVIAIFDALFFEELECLSVLHEDLELIEELSDLLEQGSIGKLFQLTSSTFF